MAVLHRGKEIARSDHIDEVKRNVLVVGELVDILSGEQRYLQRKLDRHMETCVSGLGVGRDRPRSSLGVTLRSPVPAAAFCPAEAGRRPLCQRRPTGAGAPLPRR